MDPFAATADLEDRLQVTFTVDQEAAALRLLKGISGRVRDITGQTIYPETVGATQTWRSVASKMLFLPHPPIIPITVTAITVDGEALGVADWTINDVHGLSRTEGSWAGDVVATYTHGFSVVPDSLNHVVLEIAARKFDNPQGVTQLTAGPFSQSFGNDRVQGWRADDMAALSRYTAVRFQ